MNGNVSDDQSTVKDNKTDVVRVALTAHLWGKEDDSGKLHR